jgi:hypothetical protein
MHPLDQATNLAPTEAGLLCGQASDIYWNFGGPFGGVTAATLMRAVLEHEARAGDPVSITVNFVAAIARAPFQVSARIVRTGKSLQHWYVELMQAGVVAANATVLCARRQSTWAHCPAVCPSVPPPEAVEPMPTDGRNTFVRQFEFRFVEGALQPGPRPDGRPGSARSCLWLNNASPRDWDFIGLTTLCDLFFGRIYFVRGVVFPIATVSMTAYFHADSRELAQLGSGPLLGIADAHTFEKGFFDQTAQIWSRGRRLLATTTQIVNYRD